MKLLITVLLLIVSTPTFAAVGDRYICDTVRRPLYDVNSDNNVTFERGEPEEIFAKGFSVKFYLNWESSESVELKRLDTWQGKTDVRWIHQYPISVTQFGAVTGGFLGRITSDAGDYHVNFNGDSGRLLFVEVWGSTEEGLDIIRVEIWHLKCIKV